MDKLKFISKVSAIVIAVPVLVSSVPELAFAGGSCYASGNSIYCSDGYSAYSSGNSVYGSDGYSAYSSGNSIYGSDGYSSYSSGNSWYYSYGN